MKKFILIILLLSCISFAEIVDFSEPDKVNHVLATSLISYETSEYLRVNYDLNEYENFFYTSLITIVVGDLKERFSERISSDSPYSFDDMKANLVGSFFGYSISFGSSQLESRKRQHELIRLLKSSSNSNSF